MTNGRTLVLAFTFKLGQKQAQLRSAMETVKYVPNNVSEVQWIRAAVSTTARCCACWISLYNHTRTSCIYCIPGVFKDYQSCDVFLSPPDICGHLVMLAQLSISPRVMNKYDARQFLAHACNVYLINPSTSHGMNESCCIFCWSWCTKYHSFHSIFICYFGMGWSNWNIFCVHKIEHSLQWKMYLHWSVLYGLLCYIPQFGHWGFNNKTLTQYLFPSKK